MANVWFGSQSLWTDDSYLSFCLLIFIMNTVQPAELSAARTALLCCEIRYFEAVPKFASGSPG